MPARCGQQGREEERVVVALLARRRQHHGLLGRGHHVQRVHAAHAAVGGHDEAAQAAAAGRVHQGRVVVLDGGGT